MFKFSQVLKIWIIYAISSPYDSSYSLWFWILSLSSVIPCTLNYEIISNKRFIFASTRCPRGCNNVIFYTNTAPWAVFYHVFKFRLYTEKCHRHKALVFLINLLGWLNPRPKYVYVGWGWDAITSLGCCRGSCSKAWEVGIPEQIYRVRLSHSPLGEWLWALGGSGGHSLHQGFEKYFGGDCLASLKFSRGDILYRPGRTVASISISSVQQRRWNPREAKAKWWHLITRDKVGTISVISNRTRCSWSHKQSPLVLVKDHGHHRGGKRDGHSATYLICVNREVLDQVSKGFPWMSAEKSQPFNSLSYLSQTQSTNPDPKYTAASQANPEFDV